MSTCHTGYCIWRRVRVIIFWELFLPLPFHFIFKNLMSWHFQSIIKLHDDDLTFSVFLVFVLLLFRILLLEFLFSFFFFLRYFLWHVEGCTMVWLWGSQAINFYYKKKKKTENISKCSYIFYFKFHCEHTLFFLLLLSASGGMWRICLSD